ncbi:MAG: HAD hydrolase-like protein, partial [Armatimonadota bacterium]|nr:HAD hydrolase-like protein [Armatimonadota bacterium]
AGIAALEASSGRQVETVVGKPSPIMGRVLLQRLGTAPADSLLVGDRLETDHALGLAVGMATAVVLTGVTTREAALAAQPRPDYILECVSQVLPASP